MIKKFQVLVGLALLAGWLAPVFGQAGRMSGTVTDPQGNPLEGVLIRIEGMDVRRKYEVKTGKDGKYLHAGVNVQGTYRVVAEKEGYLSDYVERVKAGFGDDRGVVDFVLNPGTGGVLAFELTDEQRQQLQREAEEAEKRAKMMETIKAEFQDAIDLYNAGNYDQAREVLVGLTEKDAEQPSVWAHLGNTYEKLKRYDEGITAYNKAIELTGGDDPGMYQNLGNIYSSKGDTAKAKEMYEKSAELSAALDPKAAATTYYNMGVTYINTGNMAEAAEALNKAIEADPAHAEAHYQLGITLLGLNKIQDAVTHLKKYIELAPTGPNAETAKALVSELG